MKVISEKEAEFLFNQYLDEEYPEYIIEGQDVPPHKILLCCGPEYNTAFYKWIDNTGLQVNGYNTEDIYPEDDGVIEEEEE